METIIQTGQPEYKLENKRQEPVNKDHRSRGNGRPGVVERKIIWYAIRLRIFYFVCRVLRSPSRILKTYKVLLKLRSDSWGGDLKKIYKVGDKYFFNQYTPGWPSKAYDELIKGEIRRHADPLQTRENLSFIFLAITRKCPMRCEHCFEWKNLNKQESFTKEDLFKTIDVFQKEGVLQFHFSGGEPMVRFKDLVELITYASKKSECWVVTSGFNVTEENAGKLKQAGCRGMVVSIDHYLPEAHNLFRGRAGSFYQAVQAVINAGRAGLVTSLSVCATRAFLDQDHLLRYMDFAKGLGVQFVQVLEPKDIGNYEGKNVLLTKKHIDRLEQLFTTMNLDPACEDYPTMLYHGFHQRRIGCFSGSRSVYVDSAGDVHACPFCHTRAYNIIELVRNGVNELPRKENSCPRYGKIA